MGFPEDMFHSSGPTSIARDAMSPCFQDIARLSSQFLHTLAGEI